MKTDKVYQIGDHVIRAKSKRVADPKNLAIRRLITKMIRIMRREHLVGIAAPQVGAQQRVFVTQPRSTKFRSRRSEGGLAVYVNPRIVRRSKAKHVAYEGCGSVAHAGIFGKVARSKTTIIQAQDQHGRWFTRRASGFLARIVQHEYDHLEGVVFLDKVKDPRSLLSRESYLRKFR